MISGKVFQLISRNLLWLGLESPHHFWPAFGFCPSGTKRCVANLATFWTPCYTFSWRCQAKETLSFLKANNNIPYLISEKLKILLFIQLSTQWHQMPSKTLERRRATPSEHRMGWVWSGFVFRSTGRIGLIPTGTSKTCGILAFLFRHCERDGSYVYLRSEGGEWRYTRKQGL